MKRDWESKSSRQLEGGILINHYANAEGFVGSNRNTEKEEMNKTKIRCLSLAMVLVGILVIGSGVAFAGGTGLGISITCDNMGVADQGELSYLCFFTVINNAGVPTNADLVVSVDPPGAPGAAVVQCFQGVTPVNSLGAFGTATDRCTGDLINGTVPFTCNAAGEQLLFTVSAIATNAGGTATGETTNGPFVNGISCDDQNACTIDSCVPTSDPSEVEGCVHTPDPACDSEFCRTAGFWSTHTADSSSGKTCAQNITQAVLDAGGPLDICGESLCTTAADDASSTTEAMCVNGGQERQLARQLTAAALNCIVTNGSASCDGVSINAAFDACNTACATNVDADPTNDVALGDCISVIDCFNNGGVWDDVNDFCATGTCGSLTLAKTNGLDPAPAGCTQEDLSNCEVGQECIPFPNNCHDALFGDFENVTLPNDLLPDTDECFERQGPADSADCKAAKKSDCLIFGEHEADCDTESSCIEK